MDRVLKVSLVTVSTAEVCCVPFNTQSIALSPATKDRKHYRNYIYANVFGDTFCSRKKIKVVNLCFRHDMVFLTSTVDNLC